MIMESNLPAMMAGQGTRCWYAAIRNANAITLRSPRSGLDGSSGRGNKKNPEQLIAKGLEHHGFRRAASSVGQLIDSPKFCWRQRT